MTEIAELVALEDEQIHERRMRVLTMRNAGAVFTQITEVINRSRVQARIEAGLDPLPSLSVTTIRKDHAIALREVVAASREDIIAEHRSVLLDLRRANYAAAMNGDTDAAKVVLSTLEREARMFGTDAPTRHELGVSDVDFAQSFADLVGELGLAPPKEILDAIRHTRDDFDVLDGEVIQDADVCPVTDGHVRTSAPASVERAETSRDGTDEQSTADDTGWSNLQ